KLVGFRTGNRNGVRMERCVCFAKLHRPAGWNKPGPEGITGDKRLRKYGQLRAASSRFADQRTRLLDGSLAVEINRAGLNSRNPTGFKVFHRRERIDASGSDSKHAMACTP